jgi:hypothetical protein
VGGQLGSLAQDDAVAAVLVDDRLELVPDIIQGLVPAGLAPVSGTTVAHTDHRALYPLAVVKQ